jgi:hypothetical protein
MRKVVFVSVLIWTVSCGGAQSPVLPTPTPTLTPDPQPQTLTLSGNVSETAPTTSTRVSGATITILDGPDAGKSATSDRNGVFHLEMLRPGGFAIETQAADYVAKEQFVTVTANQTVTIELDPVFEMVTTTANDSIGPVDDSCLGYWDYLRSATHACEASYVLPVHHTGTLTARLTWPDRGSEPLMEVYRRSRGQVTGPAIQSGGAGSSGQIRTRLNGHAEYVIFVSTVSSSGAAAPATTPFSLTFTRPN